MTTIPKYPTVPTTQEDSCRGSIGRGCLIGLGIGVVLLLIAGGSMVSQYNSLVGSQEKVRAAYSEIDNQYKRRYDLIPNLVETVKGAANFEKSTLQEVTQARASVGKVQLPSTLPTDPKKLQAYLQAQQSLGSALGRLLAVAERYPDLKASQNFLALQDQLEGSENRITVARRNCIDAVRSYNTGRRSFPTNFIAGTFNFEPAVAPEIEAGEREVPKVDFGGKNK